MELPESLRNGLAEIAAEVASIRESAKSARGPDRDAVGQRLALLDRDLLALVTTHAPPEMTAGARKDAEQDLSIYRGRLAGAAWTSALTASTAQMLRDRLGLPTLET